MEKKYKKKFLNFKNTIFYIHQKKFKAKKRKKNLNKKKSALKKIKQEA